MMLYHASNREVKIPMVVASNRMLDTHSHGGAYLVFAAEQYRFAKGLTGAEVAALFERYGVSKFIMDSFELFHIESGNSWGQTPQNRCKRPVCALLPVCATDLPRSYLYETMAPARRHIHRGYRPSREARDERMCRLPETKPHTGRQTSTRQTHTGQGADCGLSSAAKSFAPSCGDGVSDGIITTTQRSNA